MPHHSYLLEAIKQYDKNNSGMITFFNLRNIFETINLKLKDNYVEYLIYFMKNFNDDKATLEDLKYEVTNLLISRISSNYSQTLMMIAKMKVQNLMKTN